MVSISRSFEKGSILTNNCDPQTHGAALGTPKETSDACLTSLGPARSALPSRCGLGRFAVFSCRLRPAAFFNSCSSERSWSWSLDNKERAG